MKKVYGVLILLAGVLLSWQELDAAILGSGPPKSKMMKADRNVIKARCCAMT